MRRAGALLLLLGMACGPDDALAQQDHETTTADAVLLFKGKFAPRDECGDVAGAAFFRRKLAAAVQARDPDAVAALAASDVVLDFDSGVGPEELRRRLIYYPGLWRELDALLALGCAANERGEITIPWYFEQDLGGLDVFDAFLVVGEDVPLVDLPDTAGKRLASLTWDLVRVADYRQDAPFQQTALPDGTMAFIASDKLRSVIDYRLVAESRDGKWGVTSFLAGD